KMKNWWSTFLQSSMMTISHYRSGRLDGQHATATCCSLSKLSTNNEIKSIPLGDAQEGYFAYCHIIFHLRMSHLLVCLNFYDSLCITDVWGPILELVDQKKYYSKINWTLILPFLVN
ncbi:hypothetical protein ACJX0J_029986, partial [Zea mays]